MKSALLRQNSLSGVIALKDDFLWQLFMDTGDPVCWVIYRRAASR